MYLYINVFICQWLIVVLLRLHRCHQKMAAKHTLWTRLLWPWGLDTSMFLCLVMRAWLGFLKQWRWCCFLLLDQHFNQLGVSLLINRASLPVSFSLACLLEPIRGELFRINTDGGWKIFHLVHQFEFCFFIERKHIMRWESLCAYLSYLSSDVFQVIKAKCFFFFFSWSVWISV